MGKTTRNLIDKDVPSISLRAAAGESLRDANEAAAKMIQDKDIPGADRLMASAYEGASAMEIYYAQQKDR